MPPDDVDLDTPVSEAAPGPDATAPIYSHCFSLRLQLLCPATAVEATLAPLSLDRGKRWVYGRTQQFERWTLRGSTFLSGRRPTPGRALGRFNQLHRTRMYSLQVERTDAATFIDVHGVRLHDVYKLAAALGLRSEHYKLLHFRRLERYFVLPPHEAMRLSRELGGWEQWGAGRTNRKQYLLRDHKVPVVLGVRKRRTALVTIYRIGRGGATAAYKVEAVLKGRTRDRSNFDEMDAGKLDEVLGKLIEQHDLQVMAKPERWEPRGASTLVRDGALALLPSDAYRGRKPSLEALRGAKGECHTLTAAVLGLSPIGSDTSTSPPHIRHHISVSASSLPPTQQADIEHATMTASAFHTSTCQTPVNRKRVRGDHHYRAVSRDILRFPTYLSEVMLDPSADPADFVRTFLDVVGPGAVNLMVYTDERVGTWGSLVPLLKQSPGTDDSDTLMIVMDPFLAVGMSNRPAPGCVGERTPDVLPVADTGFDATSMSRYLWDLLEGLRAHCESTGLRIVLVSVDARPDHGRGELRRSHFFRDGRVRSSLGDAGRYWAHTRYLVEERWHEGTHWPHRAVMVKDEAEGAMGRVISS